MTIKEIIASLETMAPLALQESYDNAGLILGDPNEECTGAVCSLDLTEQVIDEAFNAGANLIISHHPIIFKGLKSLVARTYVERCLLKAIEKRVALYAIHTNYDNVFAGVNRALALKIGLEAGSLKILSPLQMQLAKLYTYVPPAHAEKLKTALFAAGAGKIGLYDECGFETLGKGSFRPLAGSDPFIGAAGGQRESVEEMKFEVVFPVWNKEAIIRTLKQNHPYEEVAYEILVTENEHPELGAGMVGTLPAPLNETEFLGNLQRVLGSPCLRHSPFTGKTIQKVAVCGGSGSFLQKAAKTAGADAFVTADLKYHEFFDPNGNYLLVDAGHYETEIMAVNQLAAFIREKFPTFAVLKTGVSTNPVQYYTGK